MAYSSDYNRKLYENDCKLLVKAITKFKEEEENFKICLDFSLSNLLYHSYLDVNGHKVKHSISGLHEKYLVQSDLEKAKTFKSVSDHLFQIIDKKYGSEKEASYGVLDLLLRLSQSNYQNLINPQPETPQKENADETETDWASYLGEDDIKYVLSDTSSELFTSDEDSIEEIDGEREFLRPPPRDDSGLGISPDSCSGSSQQQFHVNNIGLPLVKNDCAKNDDGVVSKIFQLYWISKHQKSFTTNPHKLKTMNFTKLW